MPNGIHHSEAFDAYAEATIRHKIDALIGRFGYREQDREDLEQELRLVVWERLQDFQPDQVQRSTFIDRVVCQRLTDLIRAKHRHCRDQRRECRVAEDESGSGNELDLLPGSIGNHHAELQSDLAQVLRSLSQQQARICELLASHSKETIKRMLGLSRRAFDAELAAIRAACIRGELHGYLA
ncbi:MAG: hypothetical protein ACOCXA_05625 [Planctomycetota bacterium]